MNQEQMLEVRIICPDHLKEIITAELSLLPYEGFWDSDDTIIAYISETQFEAKELSTVLREYDLENNFKLAKIEPKNWNEEWESQFKPFELGTDIRVRAEFHPSVKGFTHEIIIKPKMSFGTGHHETTQLMMEMMLGLSIKGKHVLDMGSGTGILSILAEKMGANAVLAIDNDPNACENMPENFLINNTQRIYSKCGGKEILKELTGTEFQLVLSNITKNINLDLLPELCSLISINGELLISGFLDFDFDDMVEAAQKHGLQFARHKEMNGWQAALFIKNVR